MKNIFKVLVLEDDHGVRELLHNIISRMCPASEITLAEDASIAFSKVMTADEHYDFIISDINLKGLTDNMGLEFIKNLIEVKGDEYRKKILVISSDYEGLQEAGKLGFRFLAKPFEISEIQEVITSMLNMNNNNNIDIVNSEQRPFLSIKEG